MTPLPGPAQRSASGRGLAPALLILACFLPACTPPEASDRAGAVTDGAASAPAATDSLEAATEGRVLAPTLTPQQSGVDVLLQAVSPVDREVVWASGHGGTWVRTLDGGASWQSGAVPGADSLQFRDVHAFGADTAVLLSAGSGELSRVYRTTDGGRSWRLRWTNPEPEGFYDCLDFWDAQRGALYGDAVDGSLRVLVTDDGGRSWERLPADALPDAQEGEGGFAASGTCLRAGPNGAGWIATGAAPVARILRTENRGAGWGAGDVPVVAGDFAGLTTVSFLDADRVIALGGDLGAPDDTSSVNVARSSDGGRTWTAAGRTALPGAVYGSDWAPASAGPDGGADAGSDADGDVGPDGSGAGIVVAVGPAGADASADGGRSWRALVRDTSFWAVALAPAPDAGAEAEDGPVGWMTGPEGRIVRIDF